MSTTPQEIQSSDHSAEVGTSGEPSAEDMMIPKLGMEFDSEEEAYDFYNEYAKRTGFSLRRGSVRRTKSGAILDRLFVCSCEGVRVADKRDATVRKHRAETRFGCLARMRVSFRVNGKYQVYRFVCEHSHPLINPSKSHFLRSHRCVSDDKKSGTDTKKSLDVAPEVAIRKRYEELSGLFNQLASRASKTQETYEIALAGYNKVLKDVEEKLKSSAAEKERDVPLNFGEVENSESLQVESAIPVVASTSLQMDEPKDKGTKGKPKKNKNVSSKGCMNTLEEATKKRRFENPGAAIHNTSLGTQNNLIYYQYNSENQPMVLLPITQGSNHARLNLNAQNFMAAHVNVFPQCLAEASNQGPLPKVAGNSIYLEAAGGRNERGVELASGTAGHGCVASASSQSSLSNTRADNTQDRPQIEHLTTQLTQQKERSNRLETEVQRLTNMMSHFLQRIQQLPESCPTAAVDPPPGTAR